MSPSNDRGRRITLRGVGVVLVVVGLGAAAFLVVQLAREHRAAFWPSVTGRLITGQVRHFTDGRSKTSTFSIQVEYSYAVNGESYSGDRYRLTTESVVSSFGAAHLAETLKPGGPVEVYYHPRDPALSCLRPGGTPANWVRLAIAAVIAFGGRWLIHHGPSIEAKRRWG